MLELVVLQKSTVLSRVALVQQIETTDEEIKLLQMDLMQVVWRPELQVVILTQHVVVDSPSFLEDGGGNLSCRVVVLKETVVQHDLKEGVLLDEVLLPANGHRARLLNLVVVSSFELVRHAAIAGVVFLDEDDGLSVGVQQGFHEPLNRLFVALRLLHLLLVVVGLNQGVDALFEGVRVHQVAADLQELVKDWEHLLVHVEGQVVYDAVQLVIEDLLNLGITLAVFAFDQISQYNVHELEHVLSRRVVLEEVSRPMKERHYDLEDIEVILLLR